MSTTQNIQKTAAEDSFNAYFQAVGGTLPGDIIIAGMRSDAMKLFLDKGLPNRRLESWRYTDLRTILKDAYAPVSVASTLSQADLDKALGALGTIDASRFVFVDGQFSADLSADFGKIDNIDAMPLAQAMTDSCFTENFAAAKPETDDSVVALNTAFMRDGAALNISGVVEKPVHMIFVSTGAEQGLITLHNHISVAKEAKVTLLESYIGVGESPVQVNAMTNIGIGTGAKVDHVKYQAESLQTTHLSTQNIRLEADAHYNEHQFNIGGALSRNQHFVKLDGEKAEFHMSGATLMRGTQHCDTTLMVDHKVPEGVSRETVKCVLDDTARAVVQAKVIVRPHAQKTDGHQMMQSLMLSELCEFDAKPELEIYADDVACGHGATSGQIDEDLLFYLKSRGLPDAEARGLLIQAFVGEAIEQVTHEDIKQALNGLAQNWLTT